MDYMNRDVFLILLGLVLLLVVLWASMRRGRIEREMRQRKESCLLHENSSNLKERLARGEIGQEEYDEKMGRLVECTK